MANDISSLMRFSAPTLAKESGQFVELDAAKAPDMSGHALPQLGNALPQQTIPTKVSQSDLEQAVSSINEFVQTVQRDLNFSMDEDSGRMIIKVIDSKSGELVRQIPSEEVMAIATYIRDAIAPTETAGRIQPGLLFSDRI
jgi:flagellar protein FlaG